MMLVLKRHRLTRRKLYVDVAVNQNGDNGFNALLLSTLSKERSNAQYVLLKGVRSKIFYGILPVNAVVTTIVHCIGVLSGLDVQIK